MKTASRSVQPFLQGSQLWQTDRSTRPCPSLYPKQHLDRFSCFCTTDGRASYILQRATLPSKTAHSHGGSGSPLIHRSLGPPETTTQTESGSSEQFSQGSQLWQTDRALYSVCKNKPHLHSTAMRSNKKAYEFHFKTNMALRRLFLNATKC